MPVAWPAMGKNLPSWWIPRWWFQICFIFTPIWERFPIWLLFSDGLKPPTSFGLIILILCFSFLLVCLDMFHVCLVAVGCNDDVIHLYPKPSETPAILTAVFPPWSVGNVGSNQGKYLGWPCAVAGEPVATRDLDLQKIMRSNMKRDLQDFLGFLMGFLLES